MIAIFRKEPRSPRGQPPILILYCGNPHVELKNFRLYLLLFAIFNFKDSTLAMK